ncbi:uncharacterized protein LOC132194870 isoform X2 [Neocloeon triangulifer]|uniref:uncharacterized protein LOC132194870 isoform X2 n=1 Tax=Neocloeon triangulifer TaxID=2078957 RepID=UPI00286F80C2|nr:uncharacterized protein LOC132194870 isoform X2 [Neocloeon triangulifer]
MAYWNGGGPEDEVMVVGEEASNAAPEEGAAAAAKNGPSTKPAISSNINNIMGGMESTAGVKLHNHRRKLRQRFDIIRKLGQGTYGKVQLGINKETGQEVAIKTIKKAKIETEADLVRIRREIQIMSSVRHPNIIHIYEVFENREKMVLVMEYAAGGELYDYLSERKVLNEVEARRIFRQIATATYYCHKHKICHRDLKLENILLDELGNAKIADFGLSNVFDNKRLLSTFCGSPLYASPEIVKGTPYHGPEVDCWSLGVLLYTLVYGAMPFDGSNFKKLVKQISQGDYFEPKKPSPASPLIRDMLTVTPRKRADVEKICNHWWVNEGYNENCLEIAENLANQTPVRLDLLLSLAPAPSSDKIVVPEKADEALSVMPLPPTSYPTRSHSVGSLMDLDYPQRKTSPPRLTIPPPPLPILPIEETAIAPKRKLQECPSGETGAKRKETKPATEAKREESRKKEELMEVDETTTSSSTVTEPKEKRKSVKAKKESGKLPAFEAPPATPAETPVSPASTLLPDAENTKSLKKKKKSTEINGEVSDPKPAADKPVEKELLPVPIEDLNATVQAPDPEKPKAEISPAKNQEEPLIPTPDLEILASQPEPQKSENTPRAVTATQQHESEKAESAKTVESKKEESPTKEAVNKRRPQSLRYRTKTEDLSSKSVSPEKSLERREIPKNDVRRRSSIFEKAEMFNSLSSNNVNRTSPEKGKKMFIPGVKVSDFKSAFEKKPPTKSASIGVASEEPKKEVLKKPAKSESPQVEKKSPKEVTASPLTTTSTTAPLAAKTVAQAAQMLPATAAPVSVAQPQVPPPVVPQQPEPKKQEVKAALKPAVVAPEIKPKLSPPKEIVPPPPSQKQPVRQASPPNTVMAKANTPDPESKSVEAQKKKSTTMKITLESSPKSATLPRRTSKAEIRLNNPPQAPKPTAASPATPSMPQKPAEYRTEVEHMVGTPQPVQTQRSEVAFPVSAASSGASVGTTPAGAASPRVPRPYRHSNTAPTSNAFRSMSAEPELRKERIIPIRVEGGEEQPKREMLKEVRPPVQPQQIPQAVQKQSVPPHKKEPLSRQSTTESEAETVRGEPIRKSPREFIIPIAVEGGGYVTPRASSLEPSSDSVPSTPGARGRSMRFARPFGRFMSQLSESEGAETESTINSNGGPPSFSRMNSDQTEDELGPMGGTFGRGLHMHRLRSSRPSKSSLEHNDSLSSGDEDDEEDNFETLTAETLFSTLLNRMRVGQVRSLTQRLNVDNEMRPGFPSSRLLGHMQNLSQPPSLFSSNFPSRIGEPLSSYTVAHHERIITSHVRLSEHSRLSRNNSRGEEHGHWRRSLSRDASEGDSVYSEHHPRGDIEGSTIGDYRRQEHFRRSNSHQPTDLYKPTPYRPDPAEYYRQEQQRQARRSGGIYSEGQGLSRLRSLSLNRENSWKKNQRTTPDRSLLSRYINQHEMREMSPPPPPPPPLTSEEKRRGRRTSRFLRPDFFDTPKEDSAYAKQKEEEARLRREQRRTSTERRQMADDDARGRINRAINSLQQRSDSQDMTESLLIKRAVSSDELNEQPRNPGKVNSVLGMFRMMEKPAEKSGITRFRRSKSVYENSSSDSVPTDYQQDFSRYRRPEPPSSRTPSAFLPYRTTNSKEKLVEDDLSDDFIRHNLSRDGGQDDSFDSWSVCSDSQEPAEDETVSDRIRRKSFYTRFNDYVMPKKQPAKPSPEVTAILEKGIRKQQKQQRQWEQQEQQRRQQNSAAAARLSAYGSLPRGWEPQMEQDYYQQARKLSRYSHRNPSAPAYPSQPPSRRPTRPPSPPPMVDH